MLKHNLCVSVCDCSTITKNQMAALVIWFTDSLKTFFNLSDTRSDRKIHHARPGNFLSDKFLFCVEHLEF